MRKCYMFLDDVRSPPMVNGRIWIVVRSFDEAVSHVEKHGIPAYISFDHDLGDNIPTGYDFVKWLVNQHLNNINKFPTNFAYDVHSANPPGAANIRGLLDNFLSCNDLETNID